MKILNDISLKSYNTFGIDARAKRFAPFSSADELAETLSIKEVQADDKLILGGGSNVLFVNDFDGTVLKNDIDGINLLKEDEDSVLVKVGAGENWHQFVLYALDQNWAGIENLSLIPGNVGASPMQNIGAYGVEIKNVFHELEAFHLPTGEVHTFDAKDCAFGYRESVFKNKYRGEYVILTVSYRLLKKPNLRMEYGAIQQEMEKMGVNEPNIRAVSNAVIRIRQSKLPDPKQIGNAGSFFKNPIISIEDFNELKEKFPDVAAYPAGKGKMKVAAGWLIEKAGWKGKKYDNYGVHDRQALVLVNYGGANGLEIYDLSEKIMEEIYEMFGIQLEREVNVC